MKRQVQLLLHNGIPFVNHVPLFLILDLSEGIAILSQRSSRQRHG